MILCTWAGFADNATDSALCASWWQAAGSVLAIFAAVAVAFVQHRQNLKAQRRAAQDADSRAFAAPIALTLGVIHELELSVDCWTARPSGNTAEAQKKTVEMIDHLAAAETNLALLQELHPRMLPSLFAITTFSSLKHQLPDCYRKVAALRALTVDAFTSKQDIDAILIGAQGSLNTSRVLHTLLNDQDPAAHARAHPGEPTTWLGRLSVRLKALPNQVVRHWRRGVDWLKKKKEKLAAYTELRYPRAYTRALKLIRWAHERARLW